MRRLIQSQADSQHTEMWHLFMLIKDWINDKMTTLLIYLIPLEGVYSFFQHWTDVFTHQDMFLVPPLPLFQDICVMAPLQGQQKRCRDTSASVMTQCFWPHNVAFLTDVLSYVLTQNRKCMLCCNREGMFNATEHEGLVMVGPCILSPVAQWLY